MVHKIEKNLDQRLTLNHFFSRTIGNSCENIRSELINQMKEWEGESTCGKTSVSCPRLPCGQNCLYKVSYIRMSKGPYFYYVRQIVGG